MKLVEAREVLEAELSADEAGLEPVSGGRGSGAGAAGSWSASNRQAEKETKERAWALYREQDADYGPTRAAECLLREEGVDVQVTTLRRWPSGAGWWERRRKRRMHRRRRERRACWGELLQLDGSHHDWFEGRRLAGQPASAREIPYAGWAVLMVRKPCRPRATLFRLRSLGYYAPSLKREPAAR